MNYLKVDLLGGMFLDSEDWVFNQNGLKEALKGLASVVGSNGILSGILPVDVSTGDLVYPEGFAVIEGEIFYVPAATVALNGAYYYLEVDETNDPNGYEVFEDGGAPQNTYIIRTGKIVTYAADQGENATRKLLVGLKTFSSTIKDIIQTGANTFTGRQSWAQSSDSACTVGDNFFSVSNAQGNYWNMNIDNATVDIQFFNTVFPNGTWLALRFTGTTGKTITISDGTSLSHPIITPSGKSYIFRVGETARFIVADGNYYLVNASKEKWHIVGDSGEPAFESGWSLYSSFPLRYRLNNGNLEIAGSLSSTLGYTTNSTDTVFVLPSYYRPARSLNFIFIDLAGEKCELFVNTDGTVKYYKSAQVLSSIYLPIGMIAIPLE